MFGSGMRASGLAKWTTLIISNKEINNIIKIAESFEESFLLIKSVRESMKNEAKKQKGEFVGMLFGTLDDSLLGNHLPGKGTLRTGEGTVKRFLMAPSPLANFELIIKTTRS